MSNKAKALLKLFGVAGDSEESQPEGQESIFPDWENLFNEETQEEAEATEEEEKEPEAEDDKKPEETPAEEIKPETNPKPVEETKPEVIPEPKKEEQPPQQEAFDVTKFQAELETAYQLSQDDADLMLTSPEKVIPKLAAKMHMQVLEHVSALIQSVQQSLPQVVEQTSKQVSAKEKLFNQYKEAWPELVSKEHEDVVKESIQIAKRRKPNAPIEEIIDLSGKIAYAALGKDVPTVAAPASEKPKEKAKPRPHTPAKTTSSAQTQSKPAEGSLEAFYASLSQGDLL